MRTALLWVALASASCATVSKPDLDELKPAVEAFHQRLRWKDFRGAADLIVPERREGFLKERTRLKDDKDLYITDFQLEDAKTSPDQSVARAVARLSWYRLPSTTEETAVVTNVFAWREGAWFLESQDSGPFEELRPAPAPLRPAPPPRKPQ
jgi:hypothetical protein